MKKIIILIMFFLLVGCSKSSNNFEYGYFKCRIISSNNTILIYGLTEEGEQQEVLVFPDKFEGYSGVTIGIEANYFGVINADIGKQRNLKVAIIGNVDSLSLLAFTHVPTVVINSYEKIELSYIDRGNEIIVPFNIYDDYLIGLGLINYRYGFVKSRAIFDYNYEESPNGNLYWTSYDDINEVIERPVDPTREGYTFIDWYTDIEGSSLFDFENSNNEEIDITIYAKWEEN